MALIGIPPEIARLIDQVDAAMAKQIPYATKLMLDSLAQDVKKAQEGEIRRVFDRPTPYTQRAIFMRRATKTKLQATVWVKDDLAGAVDTNYLDSQVFGGSRRVKRFERALQRAGVLPAGWYAVQGQYAQVDAYGNMRRQQIVQIIAFFDAFLQGQGFDANLGRKGREKLKAGTRRRQAKEYFLALPSIKRTAHMQPGIYESVFTAFGRSSPRPVLIFVRGVSYRARWDWEGVARTVISRNATAAWSDAWATAVRTAR